MRAQNNPIKVGEVIGRLTVISNSDKRDKWNGKQFLCKCECGNFKIVKACNLRHGGVRSCGCLFKDAVRLNIGESTLNALEGKYKGKAKRKNRDFTLSKDQFRTIIQQNCFYCNSEPKEKNLYFTKTKRKNTIASSTTIEWADQQWIRVNGIDRRDNNNGYILENSVPCCTFCNEMKMDRTEEQFIEHIKKILMFQKEKNEK